MKNVSMIILAGGESSRMGMDKADLIYKNRSFLDIQADKAKILQISDVLISGYRGSRKTDYPVVQDLTVGKGPLGGLATCLDLVENEWALVLSMDVPLVPVEALKELIDYAKESSFRAVITQCGEQERPLIGVYHRSLAPVMREEIEMYRGSVFAMLRRVGYDVWFSREDQSLFSDVNDLESYQKLLNI